MHYCVLHFWMVLALNMFLIFDSAFSTESFFRHIFVVEPHPPASNHKDSVLSHTKFIYLEPADIYTWTRFFFNFSSFPLNPICSSDVQLTKLWITSWWIYSVSCVRQSICWFWIQKKFHPLDPRGKAGEWSTEDNLAKNCGSGTEEHEPQLGAPSWGWPVTDRVWRSFVTALYASWHDS